MTDDWRVRPERGGRRITRFYIWLCFKVGRRMARPILYGIALYFFLTMPLERRASAAFLERILGRKPGWIRVYRHIFTFSTVIMDRLFFLARRLEHLSFETHGVEVFESLIAAKKGFLLASAHFGSFEAMRALAINEKGLPVKTLMYVESTTQLNAMFAELSPAVAESVIPLGRPGTMLEVKDWIRQGGIVGILADRIVQGDKLTRLDFLGAPAAFPLGPWFLASLLHVPVVLCFAVYCGNGHYDVFFELLSDDVDASRDTRQATAERLAARYADRLAHYCRQRPYNWFNLFNFWTDAEKTDA
jgi:predicted LPLAT superfamily acyltransferase